jgi:hypothetical protein
MTSEIGLCRLKVCYSFADVIGNGGAVARVVVVHGIGQEFSGPESMLATVGPAVRDGIRLADRVVPAAEDVACAFYGHLFFPPGTRAASIPDFDETDVAAGFEAELLMAWWQQAARIDRAVPGPEAAGRGTAGFVASRPLTVPVIRRALEALSHSRFMAKISEPLLVFALKQVRRYLTDTELRQRIRQVVAEAITAQTRVVVGHSLGSVIAYETLCDPQIRTAHPRWQVEALVTAGSPLGLPLIFDRLQPPSEAGVGLWPPGVPAWTNVSDPGDVVALVSELRPLFGIGPAGTGVSDRSIRNGAAMHEIGRYLRAPTTGAAIADGLSGSRHA